MSWKFLLLPSYNPKSTGVNMIWEKRKCSSHSKKARGKTAVLPFVWQFVWETKQNKKQTKQTIKPHRLARYWARLAYEH